MKIRAHDAIGGSDIAAIRGESRWATPMDVWKRVVHGVLGEPAGLPAEIGTAAEEPILVDYCQRHGIDRGAMQRSIEYSLPDEPHFRAELDGVTELDVKIGYDAKLVLSPQVAREWGDEGSDWMPTHILNQMAWYRMLSGADHMVVVACILGRAKDYVYNAEREYEAMIMRDVRRFWTENVEGQRPPAPITVPDAAYLYPSNKSDVRPATNDEAAVVATWRNMRETEKALKGEIEKAKAAVCAAIGDSEGLWLGGNDRVTWKARKDGVRVLKG